MLAGNARDAEAAFAHARTAAEVEDSHLQVEAYIRLGDVQRLAGAIGSARAAYETGRAIAEQRSPRGLANSVWQRQLTVSDDRISELGRAQGDGPEALGAYRRSLAEREALVARDPANTESQRDLAVSHDRIAGVLLAQGDAPGRSPPITAALRSRRRWLRAVPPTLSAARPGGQPRHDWRRARGARRLPGGARRLSPQPRGGRDARRAR